MIGAYLRRGLAVGLLAGLLAGAVGTLAGEPNIEEAVAIEQARELAERTEPAGGPVPLFGIGVGQSEGIGRSTQRIGLVLGLVLVGAAAGLVFGLVAVWAVGRVAGDGWARSLKLGLAAAGSLILLPAVKYPPNPPAVGDPDTVGMRSLLYLGMGVIGVLLVTLAWVVSRRLAERWTVSTPMRQVVVGAGLVVVAAVLAATMPTVDAPPAPVPAELLWRFRLGSLATQLTLAAALAAGFGLATIRAERRGAASAMAPGSGG
jgi:Probable cobalt transporter subunit (CbtA)